MISPLYLNTINPNKTSHKNYSLEVGFIHFIDDIFHDKASSYGGSSMIFRSEDQTSEAGASFRLRQKSSHFRNGDLTIINGIFAGYISNMIGGLVVFHDVPSGHFDGDLLERTCGLTISRWDLMGFNGLLSFGNPT